MCQNSSLLISWPTLDINIALTQRNSRALPATMLSLLLSDLLLSNSRILRQSTNGRRFLSKDNHRITNNTSPTISRQRSTRSISTAQTLQNSTALPVTIRYHHTITQDYHPYNQRAYQQSQASCPIYELPAFPQECSPGKRHLNYSAEKNYW